MDKARLYMSKVGVEALLLLLLFSLSLAIRLYLLIEFPHVVFLHEADAIGYFGITKSILSSWGLGDTSVHFPPFYPFLTAVLSILTGDMEFAGRLVSCIMGALIVFPVYLIGKELNGVKAGFLSALLAAFLGDFVDFSLQPLSQATYITLMTTGIWIGMVLVKGVSRMLPCFLFGLVLGSTYLTRPEGFPVFIFIATVVSISLLLNNGMAIKHKLRAVSLMAAGFLILALPYIVYLHNQTGMWTISGKAAGALIGVDQAAKLLPSGKTVGEEMKGKLGVGDVVKTPGEFIKTYIGNAGKFAGMVPEHFPAGYMVIALIGLIFSVGPLFRPGAGPRRAGLFGIAVMFGGAVSILPVFAFSNLSISVSYMLPAFPLMIIFLSTGLLLIEERIFNIMKIERFNGLPLMAGTVILFFSYSSVLPVLNELGSADFRAFADSQAFFLRDTGRWLKQNSPKDSTVMSRWSNIAFYADRKFIGLGDGEIDEVVRYARRINASHIVIDSNAVPYRRRKLEPLLDPREHHEGLKPVYAMEEYGIRVIIYEVL